MLELFFLFVLIVYVVVSETKRPTKSARDLTYKAGRLMGDIEAAQKGRAGKRIARRIVGREVGKLLRSIFK